MDILDISSALASLPREMVLPILASLGTGLIIGLDREVLGKPAGLRTHALVALASTLLTIAAAHQDQWTLDLVAGTQIVSDPTRMAHGILTGIGFLGAGVIFRDGSVVRGLTTAASLWITAALGVVYGVGMLGLGLVGSLAALLVLVGLRVLNAVLPRHAGVEARVVVRAGTMDARALSELFAAHGLGAGGWSQEFDRAAGTLTFSAARETRTTQGFDSLARALREHPDVLSYALSPHEDHLSEK